MGFGTVKDTLGLLKYNRELLRGKRDRHTNTREAYFKNIEPKYKKGKKRIRKIDKKAVESIQKRVNRSRIFEKFAFALMAIAVILLVYWAVF